MTFKRWQACGLAVLCFWPCGPSSAAPDPRARQRAIDLVKEAESAFRKGDSRLAVEKSSSALSEDPSYPRAYLWLGTAYARQKKHLLAQSAYESVVFLSPQSADAKVAIAWLRKYSTLRPTTQDTPGGRRMQRMERPLVGSKTVLGRWADGEGSCSINGRVFDRAGLMDAYYSSLDSSFYEGKVIFRNRGFDCLETWVGKRDGSREGVNQFTVLGDGKVLYTSPLLGVNDPAVRVSVSIKGYSGITLLARSSKENRRSESAVWANPLFVKFY